MILGEECGIYWEEKIVQNSVGGFKGKENHLKDIDVDGT